MYILIQLNLMETSPSGQLQNMVLLAGHNRITNSMSQSTDRIRPINIHTVPAVLTLSILYAICYERLQHVGMQYIISNN